MKRPTLLSFSDVSVRAKQSTTPIGRGRRQGEANQVIVIHSDICIPVVLKTFSSECHFMTAIDSFFPASLKYVY